MTRADVDQIAPCPLCGDAVGWNVMDDMFGCENGLCGYVLVNAYDSSTTTRNEHNTLARRAEIGRIMEDLVTKGFGPSFTIPEGEHVIDALRALAAEIERT